MKRSIRIILAAAVMIIGAMDAMAIEEATYKVVIKDNRFEIRDYAPHILAETVVEGDLEEAGNKAFSRLFRYISRTSKIRWRPSPFRSHRPQSWTLVGRLLLSPEGDSPRR